MKTIKNILLSLTFACGLLQPALQLANPTENTPQPTVSEEEKAKRQQIIDEWKKLIQEQQRRKSREFYTTLALVSTPAIVATLGGIYVAASDYKPWVRAAAIGGAFAITALDAAVVSISALILSFAP